MDEDKVTNADPATKGKRGEAINVPPASNGMHSRQGKQTKEPKRLR